MMFVALVVAFAEAAPLHRGMDPMEISEMVIPAIQSAQEPLKEMIQVEEAEKAEMHDISSAEEDFGTSNPDQTLVAQEAQQIELDTQKALTNEDKQQQDALKSLQQVDGVVNAVLSKKKKAQLGESDQTTDPIDNAVAKLQSVAAELRRDTATSNTKTEIENMQQEAMEVEHLSGGKGNMMADPMMDPMDPMMGPGGPPMPELGESGAIDDLQQGVQTANAPMPDGMGPPPMPQAAPPPMDAPPQQGAIGDFQNAMDATPAQNNVVQEEQHFQHLAHEEKEVESKENADEAVVNSLLQKLN